MASVKSPLDDVSSPYYLHPADGPGLVLVSTLLTDDNYIAWSRAMTSSLTVKGKMGFVTGTIVTPAEDDQPAFLAWQKNNGMVLSWILNSLSPVIRESVMFTESAYEIWTDLKARFSQSNIPRLFQLRQSLSNLRQDQSSVGVYFTQLKTIWDELSSYNPVCNCGNCICGASSKLVEHRNEEYVMVFLMGLNDSFAHVRDQILSMDPLPLISKVYPLVAAQEEKQKSISVDSGNSLTPLSSFPGSLEEKKCFYMMEDRYSEDYRSFQCIAMDKSTGETKESTISPALKTNECRYVLSDYTAVAVGPTIYMIGGSCVSYHCHENNTEFPIHVHADVRVFNPLKPEDGWRDVAPMHIRRWKPAAVVVDGMIYVFGGSDREEDPQDGEWYDPNTNTWHLFPAKGYIPCFPRLQASYVDPSGAKKILVNSFYFEKVETLYMFHMDKQEWEAVTHDFDRCMRSCLVVGNIIYVVLYDCDDDRKRELRGYHLIHKQWFHVELPPEIKIHFGTARLVASGGSDRLCLVWHNHVNGIGGALGRMECLELRLNESYTTGLDGKMQQLVKLSATKAWSTYFDVKYKPLHKWMIAL